MGSVGRAFTLSAISFRRVDRINLDGAAGNRILVEREVAIAIPSPEEPTKIVSWLPTFNVHNTLKIKFPIYELRRRAECGGRGN